MVLGRNGLRDERRRRALLDETLHGADASGEGNAGNLEGRVPAKPYADAARVANHAPVSVCIPKRPLSLWALLLAGAAAIAGIQSLYACVFLAAATELQPSLIALDVTARGSLASWFAAAVLSAAALGSSLVYLIRRHRTDDYRGRYRWWLWLAPLLLMLSVNAATGLHQALSGALTAWSGAEVAVGGKGWWLLAYAAIFFPIAAQLLLEIWSSRLATFFYAGTIAAYLATAAFELDLVHAATPLATVLVQSSLLLAAHFGALLTILAYGRYVYLEAHEELRERRRWNLRLPKLRSGAKKKRTRKTAQAKGESADTKDASSGKAEPRRVRVDGSHSKFGQSGSAPQVTLNGDADDADESDRRLSKAERKKLRKEGQRA